MLYILNDKSFVCKSKYIDTIEATFRTIHNSVIKHPMFKEIIHDIDEATYIDDGIIRTRYGMATINNLSSGCKTLLVALIFPDYWIDFLDAGANVFRCAVRISKDYELKIVTHGKTLDSRDDIMVELNGIQISAKDIRKVSRNKQFGTVVLQ